MRFNIRYRNGQRKPFQLIYRDNNYRRRSKQFATQQEAQIWIQRNGSDILDGTHVPDRASVTVKEAGQQWLDAAELSGLERSTTEGYETHLRLHIYPFLGSIRLSNLTVPGVRKFEDQLRANGRSHAMVRKVLVTLGTMLADAVERGLAAKNPVRDMKRNRRRGNDARKAKLQVGVDIPTPDEISRILAAAEGKWRPMLVTLIFTGLRSSELRALQWSDIDLEKGVIRVRQRVDRAGHFGPPKSAAGTRSIPVGRFVTNTLREWKIAAPPLKPGAPKIDLVFPNREGRAISHTDLVYQGLCPTLHKAGIVTATTDAEGKVVTGKNGRPEYQGRYTGTHAFRHFYASWCINRRADGGLELPPKVVQTRLGHSTVSMTLDTYGHLFPPTDDVDLLSAGEMALLRG
ncbi:MAG: tyrosine-type recombinase/integrase [Bacteroidota bacterium]